MKELVWQHEVVLLWSCIDNGSGHMPPTSVSQDEGHGLVSYHTTQDSVIRPRESGCHSSVLVHGLRGRHRYLFPLDWKHGGSGEGALR